MQDFQGERTLPKWFVDIQKFYQQREENLTFRNLKEKIQEQIRVDYNSLVGLFFIFTVLRFFITITS